MHGPKILHASLFSGYAWTCLVLEYHDPEHDPLKARMELLTRPFIEPRLYVLFEEILVF